MTLAAFIDDVEAPRQSVALFNRTYPALCREMVESFFGPMSVDVAEAATDADEPSDAVLLHDGDGNDGWKGALVAEAVGPHTYRGFWTFGPDRVDAVREYVVRTYPENS